MNLFLQQSQLIASRNGLLLVNTYSTTQLASVTYTLLCVAQNLIIFNEAHLLKSIANEITTVKVAAHWASDLASDWAAHSTVFNRPKVEYFKPFF